ncbi:hypothetical protein [Nocardia gipuzkoensis]|uniref:hypothetical protein n=1 Tax=Nocardia gipuzkoensis TaxID=2749991 RepID=UPI00237D3C52|nr:hypothetical protein [Nocardia gipuzkoensis]MDE1673822.1 hypothetical protein [Nocardia gipuzkoensis]
MANITERWPLCDRDSPARAALANMYLLWHEQVCPILDDPIRPDLSFDRRRVLDWYESTRNRAPE